MNEISRQELEKYKKQYGTDHSLGDLTPTLCRICGVDCPSDSGAMEIASVVDQAQRLMGGIGKNQKTLIFCPDAIGKIHSEKYPELLARVQKIAGFRILTSGVMPSVTPVCFCTIFTGASPDVHGIKKWEQPVVPIETIFDTFPRAGKKVAIVAVNGCSMERIFRNRPVDYISTRDDETAFQLTRMLVKHCGYDLIVSYMTNHDHMAHVTGTDSPETIAELHKAVERFEIFAGDTEHCWNGFNHLLIWAPDHGNHRIDEQSGGHGENIPEDMLVNHFYRIRGAK